METPNVPCSSLFEHFAVIGFPNSAALVNVQGSRYINPDADRVNEAPKPVFEPVVLQRYPVEDDASSGRYPLPDQVAYFALPNGVMLYKSAIPASPIQYTLRMTDGEGNPLYAACLTFSDLVDPELITGLDMDVVDADTQMPRAQFSEKCLCLLSREPHLELMAAVLRAVYSRAHREGAHAIEHDIAHLFSVPFAGQITSVKFNICSRELYLPCASERGYYPLMDVDVRPVFQSLSWTTVSQLFAALLLERRVVLLSTQLSTLHRASEVLTRLLQPLEWPHIFVPILPPNQIEYVSAPVPFLMGVRKDLIDDDDALREVCVVDLDADTITTPQPIPELAHGQFLHRLLRAALYPRLDCIDQIWAEPGSEDATEQVFETAVVDNAETARRKVQAAFMAWFVLVFHKFRSYVDLLQEDPERELIILFNKPTFLDERFHGRPDSLDKQFLSKMFETQMFASFLEDYGMPRADKNAFDILLARTETLPELSLQRFLRVQAREVNASINDRGDDRNEAATILTVPDVSPNLIDDGAIHSYPNQRFPVLRHDLLGPVPVADPVQESLAEDNADGRNRTASRPLDVDIRIKSENEVNNVTGTLSDMSIVTAGDSPAPLITDDAEDPKPKMGWRERRKSIKLSKLAEREEEEAEIVAFFVQCIHKAWDGLDEALLAEGHQQQILSADDVDRLHRTMRQSRSRVLFATMLRDFNGPPKLSTSAFDALAFLAGIALAKISDEADLEAGHVMLQPLLKLHRQTASRNQFLCSQFTHLKLWSQMKFWRKEFSIALDAKRSAASGIQQKRGVDPDELDHDAHLVFSVLGSQVYNMNMVGVAQEKVLKFVTSYSRKHNLTEEHRVTLMTLVNKVHLANSLTDSHLISSPTRESILAHQVEMAQLQQRPPFPEGADGEAGQVDTGAQPQLVPDTQSAPLTMEAESNSGASLRPPGQQSHNAAAHLVAPPTPSSARNFNPTPKVWRPGAASNEPAAVNASIEPVSLLPTDPVLADSRGQLPSLILVSGSCDGTVRIWNIDEIFGRGHFDTGHSTHQVYTGHTGWVSCLATNEKVVASGSYDRTARLWDLETSKCTRIFTEHKASVLCLEMEQQWVVTGSYDKKVRLFDTRDPSSMSIVLDQSTGPVTCIDIDTTSHRLVTGSRDAAVRAYDLRQPSVCLLSLNGHSDWIKKVFVDSNVILSASYDKNVCVWDCSTGDLIGKLPDHAGTVNDFSLVDDQLYCAAGRNATLWDVVEGDVLQTFEGHTDEVSGLAVHDTGRWMVTGSFDQTLKVWDGQNGSCISTLTGHSGWVHCMQLMNNMVASGSRDTSVKLWDIYDGRCITTLQGHTGAVNCLQWQVLGK